MTDFENLSKEQIRAALKNNLEFALNFVVDNQPDLIVSELKANGSENVVDSDTAFNNLLFLSQNNPEKLREVLSGIPYDNSAINYTGNLKQQRPTTPNEIQTRSVDWGTILAVVGAALPVVSTLIGSGGGAGGNVNSIQAQEIEAARIKAEQERKSRTNLFIIGGVIAAILIVVLVVKRPNKTK